MKTDGKGKKPALAPMPPAKALGKNGANHAELQRLETIIHSGWEAFIAVGLALKKIRDEKLYLSESYTSFGNYCQKRWGYDKTRASRAISGALIGQSIKSRLPSLELNEAQVRELAPLVKKGSGGVIDFQPAIDVIVEVVNDKSAKAVTAERIREVVGERLNRGRSKPKASELTATKALSLADKSAKLLRPFVESAAKDTTPHDASREAASFVQVSNSLGQIREWILSEYPAARVALAPVLETEGREVTRFAGVNESAGWLGNMWDCPLAYDGVTYRTPEALFQCLRLAGSDPVKAEIRAQIIAEASPYMAKKIAKKMIIKNKIVVTLCDDADLRRMERCLRLKLKAKPELVPKLLATGDSIIIEDCTKRPADIEIDGMSYGDRGGPFWGAALVDGVWRGRNQLGALWMKLRTELATSSGVGVKSSASAK